MERQRVRQQPGKAWAGATGVYPGEVPKFSGEWVRSLKSRVVLSYDSSNVLSGYACLYLAEWREALCCPCYPPPLYYKFLRKSCTRQAEFPV